MNPHIELPTINRGDTMRIRDILADIAGVAALAILTLSPLAL